MFSYSHYCIILHICFNLSSVFTSNFTEFEKFCSLPQRSARLVGVFIRVNGLFRCIKISDTRFLKIDEPIAQYGDP